MVIRGSRSIIWLSKVCLLSVYPITAVISAIRERIVLLLPFFERFQPFYIKYTMYLSNRQGSRFIQVIVNASDDFEGAQANWMRFPVISMSEVDVSVYQYAVSRLKLFLCDQDLLLQLPLTYYINSRWLFSQFDHYWCLLCQWVDAGFLLLCKLCRELTSATLSLYIPTAVPA